MKYSLVIVVVVLLHIGVHAQGHSSARADLKHLLYYWNTDLLCLDRREAKTIEAVASRIVPGRQNPDVMRNRKLWSPWYFWEVDQPGNPGGYLLLEARRLLTIPGQAGARIHFFSDEGKHLATSEFPAGWRTHLEGARFLPRGNGGYPLIEISATRSWDGTARQYYAVKGTTVSLIRLETLEGTILRNDYTAPNLTIGPAVPTRSEEACKQALASNDLIDVLQALVWLGGVHRLPRQSNAEMSVGFAAGIEIRVESLEDAKLVAAVRAREDVRKIVTALTKSEQRWIREAAELALKPVSSDDE